MKHYIDIENLREFDIDLGNGMTSGKALNVRTMHLAREILL